MQMSNIVQKKILDSIETGESPVSIESRIFSWTIFDIYIQVM